MTGETDDPLRVPERRRSLRDRLRGPWRVVVQEGSMLPGIAPGDWLLVDPMTRGWPRNGSVVVFHEPVSAELAIKRVRARAGERVPFNGGYIVLSAGEAWLEADASPSIAADAGFGAPIDSDRFGPVPTHHRWPESLHEQRAVRFPVASGLRPTDKELQQHTGSNAVQPGDDNRN